jgi:ribosome-associated protein
MREVEIRGEMIRLGQLLKLADVIASGAEVKQLLAREPAAVRVNGEPEARRGRQLHPGDVIEVDGVPPLRIAAGAGGPDDGAG